MGRIRVTTNDLLEAVLASSPQRPGPDWMTVRELMRAAAGKGTKVSESSMRRRLDRLQAEHKAERCETGGVRGGTITYWRLTNGHRTA